MLWSRFVGSGLRGWIRVVILLWTSLIWQWGMGRFSCWGVLLILTKSNTLDVFGKQFSLIRKLQEVTDLILDKGNGFIDITQLRQGNLIIKRLCQELTDIPSVRELPVSKYRSLGSKGDLLWGMGLGVNLEFWVWDVVCLGLWTCWGKQQNESQDKEWDKLAEHVFEYYIERDKLYLF